jgi:hypothetical protein
MIFAVLLEARNLVGTISRNLRDRIHLTNNRLGPDRSSDGATTPRLDPEPSNRYALHSSMVTAIERQILLRTFEVRHRSRFWLGLSSQLFPMNF